MKRIVLYSLVLVICLGAGCKKDGQKNTVYLLHQQITYDPYTGAPPDTATYDYDDKNHITSITDGTFPHNVKFTMEYDSQDRVSTARKFGSNGNLIIQFDFFYEPNNVGYIFHGGSLADTAYLVFDGKNQVTAINTKHSGSQKFTYDNNGDVASTESIFNDGSSTIDNQTSFTYDGHQNPLSMSSPNNYFYMYVVRQGNPSTLKHNVAVRNADTFVYTYNQAGFPISAQISTILSTIQQTFKYITK